MNEHPFERILLATEHTEFDVGAERVAFELAGHCGVPLAVVIPVESNPEFEAAAPARALRVEHAVSARSDELRAAARAASVPVDIHIRRGDEPYREIVAAARALGSNLIVARRRGKDGFLARMMVGEMVGNVVREAPCSVLLVPRACRMWSARILVAVDDSPAAAAVVATACRVAAGCGLPLIVASVAAHDTAAARAAADAALARALQAIGAAGREADGRVAVGPAAESVVAIARDAGADLVIVGRGGGHSALRRLVFGSTARKIAGLATCPVLVVGPAFP
ncbi:MAG: universal stress protein [Betaproteobacteria bacterium]|nr:universal stress protein [Betaproteobacteria bacterium]MBK9674128.1 universal stress protein [Betaproteobacteria bacterium]MBL0291666.1 universal stress protein [Betaproteobacteria bacterium]